MAEFVQQAKDILGDEAPGFLELDRIETPPIDFADALMRSRSTTVADIERLALSGALGRESAKDTAQVVHNNVRVTFHYLLMQLHVRGTREFWADVEEAKLYAYLAFRTVDQYADVLTHVTVEGFQCAPALQDLVAPARLHGLRQEFTQLLALIRAQRAAHAGEPSWHPTQADVQAIMQQHANANLTRSLRDAAAHAAGWAALFLVVGLVAHRWWASKPLR